MGRRNGSSTPNKRKKAEILVVAEQESNEVAVKRFGISERGLTKWKKDYETDKELQRLYDEVSDLYFNDLLTPSKRAIQVLTNRLIDIGVRGCKYKGEMREIRESLQTLHEAVSNLRDEQQKDELKQEIERLKNGTENEETA